MASYFFGRDGMYPQLQNPGTPFHEHTRGHGCEKCFRSLLPMLLQTCDALQDLPKDVLLLSSSYSCRPIN